MARLMYGVLMSIEWVETEFCKVACCDCREALAEVQADCVITDPPYGISYKRGAGGKGRHTKRNDSAIIGDDKPFDPRPFLKFRNIILWGADHYADSLPHGRWLAWNKLGMIGTYDDFSDVEFAWHSIRGAARIFSLMWKGICQDKAGEGNGERWHPTQKPIGLMKWCIEETGIGEGETVFDPFMGSGTTAIACIRTGRKFIGCEIDRKYFDIALKRIREAEGEGSLFPPAQAAGPALLFDDAT